MTAWRVGVAIKPEQQFGVEDTSEQWHYVGVGMDMSITESNNWRFQNGMGSKTAQLEYEGRFSGTWNGSLCLDYNNFYWLLFGLENYGFFDGGEVGYHVFSVSNSKALRSFSMRFCKLDKTVGGPFDEDIVLLGCVMGKVNPTYESGSAQVKCSISGKFVDTITTAVELSDSIAYTTGKNKVTPINWGCLQVLNEDGDAWEKIANNEKTSFSFDRTINTIPECGIRKDTAFYEGAVQPISIGTQIYSRNPNQWQTRMHTGGIRNDIAVGGTSTPREKGLQPIPNIRIASQTSEGDYSFIAQFEDAVVDTWGNTYNSNSEIVEQPSVKQINGVLVVKTPDVKTALIGEPTVNTAIQVTYAFNNGTTPDLVMYYTDGYKIKTLDYRGTKSGYTFGGWLCNGVTYAVGEEVILSESMTFTAIWIQDQVPEPSEN